MKLKIRYFLILICIFTFFMLGYFIAVRFRVDLAVDKSIMPTFFQVFISNLASSTLLMLSNLLFGLGIFGVAYLAFSLGVQFYSVVLSYGAGNLLSIIFILSIHGMFEIAAMMTIFSTAISNLSIWKNYLFGDLENLFYAYKMFLKTTFIKNMFLIFIFILIGSLLEVSVSVYLFKCLN